MMNERLFHRKSTILHGANEDNPVYKGFAICFLADRTKKDIKTTFDKENTTYLVSPWRSLAEIATLAINLIQQQTMNVLV